MNKRTVLTVLKYALALGLLGFVIYLNWDPAKGPGLHEVWRRHVVEGQPIHNGYLALAFVIGFAALVTTFVRWYVLVRAVHLPFRMADAMRLGFVGFFYNTFLPGAVGGDAVKAWFLAKEHYRRTVAVATVVMDRVIALWALVWMVALLGAAFWAGGLLEGPGSAQCVQIVIASWAIVGVSVLGWALLGLLSHERAEKFAGRLARLPKVGHSAAEFWRATWMYRCHPTCVLVVLLLSWVGHAGFVFLFYCSARTLSEPEQMPTLIQHFLIVPIGLVISAVPLFPGGAGIGEAGFGGLYGWLGYAAAAGVLGSLVQRVVNWAIGLLGGLAYLRMRSALPAEATQEPAGDDKLEPEPVEA